MHKAESKSNNKRCQKCYEVSKDGLGLRLLDILAKSLNPTFNYMSFKTSLLSHQSITGLIFSFSGSLGVIILLQVCADGIGTVLTENAFHLDSLTNFLRERC